MSYTCWLLKPLGVGATRYDPLWVLEGDPAALLRLLAWTTQRNGPAGGQPGLALSVLARHVETQNPWRTVVLTKDGIITPANNLKFQFR